MTASRWLGFAFGLALTTPVAAYAYGTPALHHYGRHAATAPAARIAPEARLWRPSYMPSHSLLEIQGLSRNPNDCVKYGCIGNN